MVATRLRSMERRHDARVASGGSVVVHAHGGARGRIVDLSSSGARIQLAEHAPAFAPGDRIWMHLHLDRAGARWMRLGGEVTRADAGGGISVAFLDVPSDFADRVQDELVVAIEAGASSQILLVDPDVVGRQRLIAELGNAGCRVVAVATPLEALRVLGGATSVRWLVAIGRSVPDEVAGELRAYVEHAHPQLRVVSLAAARVAGPVRVAPAPPAHGGWS